MVEVGREEAVVPGGSPHRLGVAGKAGDPHRHARPLQSRSCQVSTPANVVSPIRVGRRERKKLETRERIFESGVALFATHGYDSTTMEQIGKRGDVSRATVFNDFARKEDIVSSGSNDYEPSSQGPRRGRPAHGRLDEPAPPRVSRARRPLRGRPRDRTCHGARLAARGRPTARRRIGRAQFLADSVRGTTSRRHPPRRRSRSGRPHPVRRLPRSPLPVGSRRDRSAGPRRAAHGHARPAPPRDHSHILRGHTSAGHGATNMAPPRSSFDRHGVPQARRTGTSCPRSASAP